MTAEMGRSRRENDENSEIMAWAMKKMVLVTVETIRAALKLAGTIIDRRDRNSVFLHEAVVF